MTRRQKRDSYHKHLMNEGQLKKDHHKLRSKKKETRCLPVNNPNFSANIAFPPPKSVTKLCTSVITHAIKFRSGSASGLRLVVCMLRSSVTGGKHACYSCGPIVKCSGGALVTGDAPHCLFAVAVIRVFWRYRRQFWGVWLASRLSGTVFEVKEWKSDSGPRRAMKGRGIRVEIRS